MVSMGANVLVAAALLFIIDTCSPGYVYEEWGSNAILPCSETRSPWVWEQIDSNGDSKILSTNGNIQPGVEVSKFDKIGNSSLLMKNVQLSDDGTYNCKYFFDDSPADENNHELVVTVTPNTLSITGDEDGLNQGSIKEVMCVIGGAKPQPVIGWTKKGQQEPLGKETKAVKELDGTWTVSQNLSVQVTASIIHSVFVCTASIVETQHNITVERKLNINTLPNEPVIASDNYTVEGDSVRLSCFSDGGKPAPNMTWYKGNSTWLYGERLEAPVTFANMSDGTVNASSFLTLKATSEDHGKTVTCRVNNLPLEEGGWNPRFAVHTLNIYYKPRVEPANATYVAVESSLVVLPCSVSANPEATVRWYLDTKQVNVSNGNYLGGRDNYTNLVIPLVTSDHEGRWQCDAVNEVGKGSGTLFDLDVQFAPIIEIGPDLPITGRREGLNVTLTCSVIADPPRLDYIKWYGPGGKEIWNNVSSTTSGRYIHRNESLIISSLTRGVDSGLYQCQARNVIGERLSDPLELQVQYAPENITITPSNVTLSEGDILPNMTCNVAGAPYPMIEWTLNDFVIGNETVLQFNHTASPDDHGVLKCFAKNTLGYVEESMATNITYKPACISGQPAKYAVTMGQSVTVSCYVRANPRTDTHITMTFGGRSFYFSGDVDPSDPFTYYASLQHEAKTDSDYGTYVCNANTTLGSLRQPCQFEVVKSSKPEAPYQCAVLEKTNSSFEVKCQEGFDGGSNQTFSLQFKSGPNYYTQNDSSRAEFSLGDLQSATEHTMRVCAANTEFKLETACSQEFIEVTTYPNSSLSADDISVWIPPPDALSGATTWVVCLQTLMLLQGILVLLSEGWI